MRAVVASAESLPGPTLLTMGLPRPCLHFSTFQRPSAAQFSCASRVATLLSRESAVHAMPLFQHVRSNKTQKMCIRHHESRALVCIGEQQHMQNMYRALLFDTSVIVPVGHKEGQELERI